MQNQNLFESKIKDSLRYLASSEAIQSINANLYWPKWNSPWWHMLLLHEMGQAKRIPRDTILRMVQALDKSPAKTFPIHSKDLAPGLDAFLDTHCHCSLGNIYQVLAAWGVDVDHELPWIRAWFLKYQMPDGGLNCDSDAYLVQDEVPSSMVGTIAAFEAVLFHSLKPWTTEEMNFLNKAAQFLIHRKLLYGSDTVHNAEEQESAKKWTELCFPRFYFYDILRGLNALLAWSEKTKQALPAQAIADVVTHLSVRFPNGDIQIGRQAYGGVGTFLQARNGAWSRHKFATSFPLLESVSQIGETSPFLSSQWASIKSRID